MSVTPIAVGATVALIGSGWARIPRPSLTDTMLGLEVIAVDLPAGIGGGFVAFEVDGEPFIAPTRPGSTFQVELLPTTDREETP